MEASLGSTKPCQEEEEEERGEEEKEQKKNEKVLRESNENLAIYAALKLYLENWVIPQAPKLWTA